MVNDFHLAICSKSLTILKVMLRFIVYILLLNICFFSSVWADGSRYASNSVFSKEGRWVKLEVSETGIYKLSYSQLKSMGFSDPSKVSVHGYGGWPLEEDFSKAQYIDDVPSIAVWRGNDYILFYAKGPRKWSYDGTQGSKTYGSFVHENNPYSTAGYYFITDASTPREMESAASSDGATLKVTTYDDYVVHDVDKVSFGSGREFFGEFFVVNLSQNISMGSIPGITNEDGKVTMRFISKVPSNTIGSVSLRIDGSELIREYIHPPTSSDYQEAIAAFSMADWIGDKKETPTVNVTYSEKNHKNVYLDYIRLQMKRTLRPYGAYTFFRSVASINNSTRFVIQNASSNTVVFDVTDGVNPKRMETKLEGSELSFSIPAGSLREFALVELNGTFPSPKDVGVVSSQDLHNLPQMDMVIIAAEAFNAQAERLAEAHRTQDNLSVVVVNPEQIYNEFSSGTPDATAFRRFMKMFYDRSVQGKDEPKYLLLFGDGSYDNRKLTTDWQSVSTENMLLTFQSDESLLMYHGSNKYSYVTDDYFGFLADSDGGDISRAKLNIGIGRFPVRTVSQATEVVDKVLSYMEDKEQGIWKNNICFVADDGNNADRYTKVHMTDADEYAETIESTCPEFVINKLYFDAFKKYNTGGNSSYPDVATNLQKHLKSGLFLLNYTGHGGTEAWSDEKVLTHAQILQANYTHLPLWITATCDFTRFDALNTSGGEDVFLNKKSGGIALFTTTRTVNSAGNKEINKKLVSNLFTKAEGRYRTLGEILKETKNSLVSRWNQLNFILIGDPALTLTFPEYQIHVTEINGKPVSSEAVQIKALETVTISGEVQTSQGVLVTDFNGVLSSTVFDSKSEISTLNNNNSGVFKYMDYPNKLYIGSDSVRSGKFTFSFMVPKDIAYSNEYGKLNLYATDSSSGIDAQGSYKNFRVGGTEGNVDDTDGPEIKALYLNDSTFVSGDKVNVSPYFVASLWDASGVNISGGSIGHDVMLIIDNQPALSYNLNSYYEILPGREGEGIIKFPIPSLQAGMHTAEFKVWDILNNSTTQTFSFEVVEGLKPHLSELTAGPVPAREEVTFYLYHNRPESKLQVNIQVFDMAGKLQWKYEETGSSELFKAYNVTWNLTNGGGSRVRPGVYLYRAAISSENSKEVTETKKLIILAQ